MEYKVHVFLPYTDTNQYDLEQILTIDRSAVVEVIHQDTLDGVQEFLVIGNRDREEVDYALFGQFDEYIVVKAEA